MITVLFGLALLVSLILNAALWIALWWSARDRMDSREDYAILDRQLAHVEREYRAALGRLSRKKRPHQILAGPPNRKA